MGGEWDKGSMSIHMARFGAIPTSEAAKRLPWGLRNIQKLAKRSIEAGSLSPELWEQDVRHIIPEGPKTLKWYFRGVEPSDPGSLDLKR